MLTQYFSQPAALRHPASSFLWALASSASALLGSVLPTAENLRGSNRWLSGSALFPASLLRTELAEAAPLVLNSAQVAATTLAAGRTEAR